MAPRSSWTTSLSHLLNTKPHMSIKPSRRTPFTPISQRKGVAHPRDRIKYWNVQVGDKIGIFRGNFKPKKEEERDRVFEVSDVDKSRNLVEIKDLPSKSRSLGAKSLARVQYSNVGLYMGKYPVTSKVDGESITEEKDVFATRLITTTPKWDPWRGHFVWRRFAASTWPVIEGYEKLQYAKRRRARHPAQGRATLVEIPWPVQKRWTAPAATPHLDTLVEEVSTATFEPTTAGMSSLSSLTPTSFPPSSHNIEKAYLRSTLSPTTWSSLPHSIPMEVFLTRELAHPHSRAKKQARWQDRQLALEELKTSMIRDAEAEASQLVGKKKAVARREAIFRWKARVEAMEGERLYERWVKRGGEENEERNAKRREKRAKRKERSIRELVLDGGARNQVIPSSSASEQVQI